MGPPHPQPQHGPAQHNPAVLSSACDLFVLHYIFLTFALWDVLWLLCAQYVGAVLCCAQLRKHIPQQTVGTLLPPGWSALPTRECQTSIYPLSRTMLYFLFICPFICLYRSLSEYCSLCVNGTNKCVALFSGFKLSGFNFGCGFGCWFWSYI